MKFKVYYLLSLVICISCFRKTKKTIKKTTTTIDSLRKERNEKISFFKENKFDIDSNIVCMYVQYTIWGCECPHWVKVQDTLKTPGIDYHFYMHNFNIDSSFKPWHHHYLVKGYFYK